MSLDALRAALHALPPPPRDTGRLERIVLRPARGERATPTSATLSPGGGLAGDRWVDRYARLGARIADREVTIIRADVAAILTAPQDPMWTGDNLHVLLDLSEENLPPGSRLRIGDALLELTARRHLGCKRFRDRFGADAARINGHPDFKRWRIRGAMLRVVEGGTIHTGAPITVTARPT